jgi:GTP-binding protein HflX
LEKDMLFATLDTTVRKITPDSHRPFLLTDTVGFIDELPHTLVKAFRSTLEEARYADLLLEVIDFSDPDYMAHMEVTDKTLNEIGAGTVPRIYVFNKADLTVGNSADDATVVSIKSGFKIPYVRNQRIYMSARTGAGMAELLELIEKQLEGATITCDMIIPYTAGNVLNELSHNGVIEQTEYLPEGTKIRVKCSERDAKRFDGYRV